MLFGEAQQGQRADPGQPHVPVSMQASRFFGINGRARLGFQGPDVDSSIAISVFISPKARMRLLHAENPIAVHHPPMRKVGVSDLRQHLPGYLARVQKGEPIQITQHGKVVARLVPEHDAALEARARLVLLRKTARLGDVLSPIGETWESEHGRV